MSFDFNYGKDAAYVWAAMGLTGLVLAWMIADSLIRARGWRAKFEKLDAASKDGAKDA